MRLLSFILAFAAMVSLRALADGAAPPEFVESPRPARPLFVVPPEFPSNVDELKEPQIVEVVGTILKSGELKVRAVSGDQAFATAVTDVLKWWRFGPAVEDCRVMDGEIFVQVSFSGSTDDPHIFVSTPKRQSPDRNAEILSTFQWSKRQSPNWPLSGGAREGEVRLLYKLLPSGSIGDVSIYSSFPPGAFDDEAIFAVKRWKVTWRNEAPTDPICMEQLMKFCQRERDRRVSIVGCE